MIKVKQKLVVTEYDLVKIELPKAFSYEIKRTHFGGRKTFHNVF